MAPSGEKIAIFCMYTFSACRPVDYKSPLKNFSGYFRAVECYYPSGRAILWISLAI